MHFSVEINVNGQPANFRFEPSSVAVDEPSYRVYAERIHDNYEFRMSKVDGQWHITKQHTPDWVQECEPQLIAAIRKREYPQDV